MLRKFRSQRIAKRRKRIFWTKFVLFIVFLIFLIWGASYVSKLEKINISNINIIGNKVIQEKDILEIVDKNLEGNYLGLFSKSNILFYPKSKIKEELTGSFLRIKDLIISFENFKSININIAERVPFALYCENKIINLELDVPNDSLQENTEVNDEIATSSDLVIGLPSKLKEGKEIEECYFMDDIGYIYAEAMSFTDDVYFKYQGKLNHINSFESQITNPLGKIYLADAPKGQFEKINLFIRFLKDINVDVYRLLIKENGDYELSFDNDSILIFDKQQDFDILLENLQAVLIDLGDLGEKEFEYIDLRFNNKVLYKFREKDK